MKIEAKPINKLELYSRGMRGLRELLDLVDAEEFIALVKSEQFDYTVWQRKHFDAKTPEQIRRRSKKNLMMFAAL